MTLEEVSEALRAIPALVDAVEKLRSEMHSFRQEFGKQKPQPVRKFLSLKQAAEELNVSEKSTRSLLHRGLLKSSKGLRVIRIPTDEIENYKRRTI
jgi:hypothetical protein